MSEDSGLARFNGLPDADAERALRACCAATQWITAVLAGRPYPDRAALADRSAGALAGLDWAGIRQALDAHPRIGERMAAVTMAPVTMAPANVAPANVEAAWSAAEQSGMDSATAETKAALVEANRAYEERFGHVFLIFATGRSDTEMLAAARERVHHDEAAEREVVRDQLGRIVDLRLIKLLDGVS